jgi:hypothetical protein
MTFCFSFFWRGSTGVIFGGAAGVGDWGASLGGSGHEDRIRVSFVPHRP